MVLAHLMYCEHAHVAMPACQQEAPISRPCTRRCLVAPAPADWELDCLPKQDALNGCFRAW